MARIDVLKTYKLFINGEFPRSESGRHREVRDRRGRLVANVCEASRKDFRNAAVAARAAQSGWSARAAFNRGQILYRLAEMIASRRDQFVSEMTLQGMTASASKKEVDVATDRLVYYAGWCDKYQQVFSTVNPVSSPHYNFSLPEPTGVVTVIAPESPLAGLTGVIAPLICGGNTIVVLASRLYPLSAISYAEAVATSDVPKGVINILTGDPAELSTHFASHMDVNAIVYAGNDGALSRTIMEACALNVKRYIGWDRDWMSETAQDPYMVMDAQEIKTTWHPIERTGGAGGGY